ncbi:arginine decarboxylase [Parelusimicrobium proximum]|uniref:Orn/Lys/Arg family decarboxylase n=1 Tax=Parelusimicrobium proximum TaxID=3228953 RepID=UPI003D179B53
MDKEDKAVEDAPFFRALQKFVADKAEMWSTPGHAGGTGLQETKLGREFYKFFGRNIFKADISSSVYDMGAILDHEGVAEEAENEAARIFGADTTLFVLNGTSTANKVVFFTTVAPGDVVLVGRNCHKSIIHSIILNEAIPVYLKPAQNAYGIIGPVPMAEFSASSIRQKIKEHPLITNKRAKKAQLTVITNSTYDGLVYNTDKIQNHMASLTHFMHFDEAWYAYAHFHPFYKERYAMSPYKKKRKVYRPPVFATQSTHKLLLAFSQGSMLHFRQGTDKYELDKQGIQEAQLIHSSTSPFYPMFASLDVSAHIMEDEGYKLIDKAMTEAIKFRREINGIYKRSVKAGSWGFKVWQADMKKMPKDPSAWHLEEGAAWHGFKNLDNDDVVLDPIKVTLLSPGMNERGDMEETGIPSAVVSYFLNEKNIIPEKSGYYNILFLFAPGVGETKTKHLVSALNKFKEAYDNNESLRDTLPDLVARFGAHYPKNMGLKDLCDKMHKFFKTRKISDMLPNMYSDLPEQVMAPHKAFYGLIEGKTEYLELDDIAGRVSASIVLPYPPGIPLIMPGEKFPSEGGIVDFLKMSEEFDNLFPGFSTEFHGVRKDETAGGVKYFINCVKKARVRQTLREAAEEYEAELHGFTGE